MCSVQDKFLVILTPKISIDDEHGIPESINWIDDSVIGARLVNAMYWVFPELKVVLFTSPQRDTATRSAFRLTNARSLPMSTSNRDGGCAKQNEQCNEESSAYEWMLFDVESSKSFIFRRNKVGAKTDPWGTPAFIWCQEEWDQSRITLNFLSVRNDSMTCDNGERP